MIIVVGAFFGLVVFFILAAIWLGLGLLGIVAKPTDGSIEGLLLLCVGVGAPAPLILLGICEFFSWLSDQVRG